MATTRPSTGAQLRRDAALSEVIEAVNDMSATLAGRLGTSPSDPLDAPDPSASIVYSDDEYDALSERLQAPPAPNERLRRTMSGRPATAR